MYFLILQKYKININVHINLLKHYFIYTHKKSFFFLINMHYMPVWAYLNFITNILLDRYVVCIC